MPHRPGGAHRRAGTSVPDRRTVAFAPTRRLIGYIAGLAALVIGAGTLALAVVQSGSVGRLSQAQLGGGFAVLVDRGRLLLDPLRAVSDRFAFPILAFVAGLAIGWSVATWWVVRHLRRSSLLLLDARAPDMPFPDAIRHVRTHAADGAQAEQAVGLILAAAARGRLSIWQRAPEHMMRRMSRRQLRRTAPLLASLAIRVAPPVDPGEYVLRRTEIENLWPRQRLIEGSARPRRVPAVGVKRPEPIKS